MAWKMAEISSCVYGLISGSTYSLPNFFKIDPPAIIPLILSHFQMALHFSRFRLSPTEVAADDCSSFGSRVECGLNSQVA